MYKYYVIVVNDDDTIWKVYGFDTQREAQQYAFCMVNSCFVVCIVSGDCMKYGDSTVIKKARKKIKDN